MKYPKGRFNNTDEPPRATTSRKGPPIQNTKTFPVKALQLEPLVNDHLLQATATTFWVWGFGRDPFNQNFRKFRSKTQWIGLVQPEKFRKNGSTFWGGPLFPVGPVGILVEWIGSVQPEKFRKNGSTFNFEVDQFSRSDPLEFWLNGSHPLTTINDYYTSVK